jgi:DNA-binding transcriptional LysR family regulator
LSNELLDAVANVSSNINATLVVAAVESVSTYVLPARLAALRERWPHARVEIVTAVCAEIRASVAAGKSDLGLVMEGDTGARDAVLKAHLAICAAPSHPLACRGATPDQLGGCDFYMSDAAGNYHDVLRRYFEAARLPLPRTQALGTIEAVKRGILTAGRAVGLLPAFAVKRELAEGVLARIAAHPPLPALACRAVLPGDGSSPLAHELIADLKSVPEPG